MPWPFDRYPVTTCADSDERVDVGVELLVGEELADRSLAGPDVLQETGQLIDARRWRSRRRRQSAPARDRAG